ncbi:HAMP domain-containing sensor histidine kinase [Conexibacter sp. SYSU D00693]|uniref:sensor histidine kinase n=1 Tax=Conexibacter sp. SYSU D00693 TaxID=2812560 RepID=UPI00196AC95A|nr:HAMP domain-containing sensor histidine kinase [Conexibacter sp. SYSU D00693]
MRRLRGASLVDRVALGAALTVAVALVLAGAAVLVASGRADRRALDRELRAVTESLREPAREALGLSSDGLATGAVVGLRAQGAPPPLLDPGEGRFARAIGPEGTAVVAGAGIPEGFPDPDRTGLRTVEAAGERWRSHVLRLGTGGTRLEVATPLTPLEARGDRLLRIVGGTFLAALAAVGLVVRFLSGVALRPLQRLREAAARVRQTGDLGVRVGGAGGPEEVTALGAELDGMLGRLEETTAAREAALASARRFAADAGHELRTPLASLAANVALARDERSPAPERAAALEAAGAEADRLGRLVDGLQALARGEAGPPGSGAVDLGDVADVAVAAVRRRHPDLAVELDAPATGPVVPHGDADGLRRVLDNLLENAAVHGATRVAVGVDARGVVVDDDGPGVATEERERVLGRFERGAGATGAGTGLGLAIVAAEAERHGGTVALEDAPLGGLRVRVGLPAQAA